MSLKKIQGQIAELQKIASQYGIEDVCADNNIKTLQVYKVLRGNLKNLPKRNGNDACDKLGNEYEIKTIGAGRKPITTGRDINLETIERYRHAHWLIGIFEKGIIIELYYISPTSLEEEFRKWEQDLSSDSWTGNNPKIPFKLLEQYGVLIYTSNSTLIKLESPPKTLAKLVGENHIDIERNAPEQLSLFDRLME